MDLTGLSKDSLEELIKQYQAELESRDKKKLYLEVDGDDDLIIRYNECMVGYIDSDGRCNMLNHGVRIANYEEWRESGMEVDTSVVEWRGGGYQLAKQGVLRRTNICEGRIYDFNACRAISGCKDTNIQRHKHNNKPILF